ncbi:hypothetical protein ACHQM5_008752 [Ranunculus cassubicifolius]
MDVGGYLIDAATTLTWYCRYVFVGIAGILGLSSCYFVSKYMIVLFPLGFLVCSCFLLYVGKWAPNVEKEKPRQPGLPPAEFEPKVVVIMAGDNVPTYLAKPVSVNYAGTVSPAINISNGQGI